MSDSSSSNPLTPAVFHVLLALAEGPLHGYAIMKRVEEDSGLSMGPGTIYGSLDRLKEAEWVGTVEAADGDARLGRSFELTPSGREALRTEARRLSRLADLAGERDPGADLVEKPAVG